MPILTSVRRLVEWILLRLFVCSHRIYFDFASGGEWAQYRSLQQLWTQKWLEASGRIIRRKDRWGWENGMLSFSKILEIRNGFQVLSRDQFHPHIWMRPWKGQEYFLATRFFEKRHLVHFLHPTPYKCQFIILSFHPFVRTVGECAS